MKPLKDLRHRGNFMFDLEDLEAVREVARLRGTDASETMNQAWYEFVVRHYPQHASPRAKKEVRVGAGGTPRSTGSGEPKSE